MQRRRDHSEREDVMRRVWALPERDRLAIYETLRAYLAQGGAPETDAERQVRLRAEALEAMRRAAEHLGLEEGEALTGPQYDQAEAALGLPKRGRVIRAYGRWENACGALTGGWVPETPAQRSLRSATSGRRRNAVAHLEGIRHWIEESGGLSPTVRNYDAYVKAHNGAIGEGELPVVTSHAVQSAFPGLQWSEIIEGAQTGTDLQTLVQERSRRSLAQVPSGSLVGSKEIAAALGCTPQTVAFRTTRPGFPRPVARIGVKRAWIVDDVVAHAQGKPFSIRRENEMQGQVMDINALAVLLETSAQMVRTWLWRGDMRRIPSPEGGRVGRQYYWLRERVETWLRDRPAPQLRSG
jgi:hypothetical protein